MLPSPRAALPWAGHLSRRPPPPPGVQQGREGTGSGRWPGRRGCRERLQPLGGSRRSKTCTSQKVLERLAEVVEACLERDVRRSTFANSQQTTSLEKSEVMFYKAWPSNVFNYALRKAQIKMEKTWLSSLTLLPKATAAAQTEAFL